MIMFLELQMVFVVPELRFRTAYLPRITPRFSKGQKVQPCLEFSLIFDPAWANDHPLKEACTIGFCSS